MIADRVEYTEATITASLDGGVELVGKLRFPVTQEIYTITEFKVLQEIAKLYWDRCSKGKLGPLVKSPYLEKDDPVEVLHVFGNPMQTFTDGTTWRIETACKRLQVAMYIERVGDLRRSDQTKQGV